MSSNMQNYCLRSQKVKHVPLPVKNVQDVFVIFSQFAFSQRSVRSSFEDRHNLSHLFFFFFLLFLALSPSQGPVLFTPPSFIPAKALSPQQRASLNRGLQIVREQGWGRAAAMQLLLFHLPLPMATSSSWPGMSPLWTKSWSPKLTLEGWGGGQLRQDGNLPSLLWTRGLSLDLILLFTSFQFHFSG